jgi:hypothetical protein
MMKFTFTDKLIAYLALLSGLSLSAVAIYYSVAGLVSIFSAAIIPIIVMGVVLEISKLIATIWLKINWTRAPGFIKAYMSLAIVVLMIITSMGIFGFLSKAHSDQSLVSGDVQSRIAIYDEKIKTERENIEANRRALKQMDEAVDQSMARSTTEQGANRAVNIRQQQAKERTRLQSEITASQKKIGALNEERAPIAAEVRKVEAEVGPIKYIAAFIYGDNPDANLLEKAVTWVIIIIVAVFDPLAVILLLASQYSFQWFRKQEDEVAPTEQAVVKEEDFKFLAEYKETLKHKPEDYDFFTGQYGTPPPYPLSEAELEEVVKAFEEAKKKTHDEDIAVEQNVTHPYTVPPPPAVTLITPAEAITIKDEPVFKEAVEAGIYNQDGTLILQDKVLDVYNDERLVSKFDKIQEAEFAPPGTPGEQWATTTAPDSSEQQQDNKLDKIYKASSEDLAKKQRNRSWFQPVFPKKD